MDETNPKPKFLIDAVWLLVLIAASSFWCVTAAHQLGATFDEPTYLQCEMEHWRSGSYKPLMRLGTMPLAIDVQTLPLYLWERLHGTKLDLLRDLGWMLKWARVGTLLFWAILLIYVYRAARSIGGSWAGRIASALVAFEPSLLGHAALATTDIALAAAMMAFVYEFRAARGKGWLRRVAVPAVLYGLAILAKASGLVFVPVCMLVIELERLCRSKAFADLPKGDRKAQLIFLRNEMWKFRNEFLAIILLGLVVTFVYCGSDWTTEPTFVEWAKNLPPGGKHDLMLWLSEHLHIFTNAGEGLVQQIKHNMRGHGSYIFGEEHRRAVWYYFPATVAIKCTIPFLLLPFIIAAVRRRALLNWPCLCAFVLLAYSVTCRVQLGIRFMFPLIALAAAGYGPAIVLAMRETESRPKRVILGSFVGAGLFYSAMSSVVVWPNAICYTNEIFGGTRNGYLRLSDSNYDWGQGVPELRKWMDSHQVGTMDVWYFGLDLRAYFPPFRLNFFDRDDFTHGEPLEKFLQGKCIAVSTTMLYGAYHSNSPAGQEAVDFFLKQKPADRTTTYFIYDFRGKAL